MRKTKANPILKVLFILLLAYLAINLINQQQLIETRQGELSAVESKIAESERLRAELEREKEMIMSDESLEKIARAKLGMIKPGERVFIDTNRQ
ncbi:MAG: septum formation initiator family protein [Clostridiales bacterium]|jgi:cell division protein FtsB|nr:septum formation initiator family protein [Clostridiales bacterium]